MQAVILAAGKSTRTYPLTLSKPKPLLKVANKTIIEHNLEQLDGIANEVFIVIGYKAQMIKDFIGDRFKRIKIVYIVQEEPLGNADALKLVEKHIKGKFILMFGDDLYSKSDLKRLLKYDNAILANKVKNPQCFGVLETKNSILLKVVEKPKRFVSDLVNVGCFVFSKSIFGVLSKIKLSKRNEYELTDAYNLMVKKEKIKVVTLKDYWLPLTYSWSLLEANEFILGKIKIKKHQNVKMEKGAVLKGDIIIGKNSLIRAGSYIEGPVAIGADCVIGPNCYIRGGTAIGDNCHIGQAVEIKNSIIGNNTNIAHLSYVGDSIVGNNCNLGAGTIVANLRHDRRNVKSKVNGNFVDSGRQKLGVIIGDGVKTGIHTSFYPGIKINPGLWTLPGDIVREDIADNNQNKQ